MLRSALTQTVLLGLAFFFLPGGYNAINSMAGGVGHKDIIAHGNTILNVLFAIVSLFAPVMINVAGPRVSLFIGALGYPLYIVALLFAGKKNSIDANWILVASAVLGICAALLWTAQGALIMAYPTKESKGTFFSYFWILFNAGGVANSLFIFASNLHSSTPTASAATFWVFIVVMLFGCCIILLLQPLQTVVRPDGTNPVVEPSPAVVPEIIGMLKLFKEPRALALIPLFLYTNWCYNYQFMIYNAPLFNIPTGGLNNAFYWGAQMLAAWLLGLYHDSERPAKQRAYVSLVGIGSLCLLTWGGGVVAEYSYNLADCDPNTGCSHKVIFNDFTSWILPLILYTMWGACDALVQCWCYWIMGQMSDDPAVLSRYSGWYKCFNSGGNAIGSALVTVLDGNVQLWINIVLFAVALPPAAYVCSTVRERKEETLTQAEV